MGQQITKNLMETFQNELNEAITELAEKHCLSFEGTRIRWSDEVMKVTAKIEAISESGEPADFARYSDMFGLPPNSYGATFWSRGQLFPICGLNPRGRKYPIIAKKDDGSRYKFNAEEVIRKLEQEANKKAKREDWDRQAAAQGFGA